MIKEEIYIRKVIVHICDQAVGMAVLSDNVLECKEELAEFLREHIARLGSGDDGKECRFYEKESEIYNALTEYDDEQFIPFSKDVANALYDIMISNVDIPSADLFVVRFKCRDDEYMAILKMDYKEYYTHRTMNAENGNNNEIIKYKSILPGKSQRISEGAIINLKDYSVRVIEKKYEINGKKENYFSYLFLKCSAHMSHKSKLSLVTKAIESVQNEAFDEEKQYEEHMKAKNIISKVLEEEGSFQIEKIAEKVFEDSPNLVTPFEEKMEKYNLVKEVVKPQADTTLRKFDKQCLVTDTGIEIKIPMEQYRDPGAVEFITNADGTVSVYIKNIGKLTAKF
ncbi:MAG: nucleoid-associated protein [Lachnospiraceae bacterium]|nr:nucleoid-associated protein [Candidatus Merdinaster equi]